MRLIGYKSFYLSIYTCPKNFMFKKTKHRGNLIKNVLEGSKYFLLAENGCYN